MPGETTWASSPITETTEAKLESLLLLDPANIVGSGKAGNVMKKQQHRARRTRKTARVADLAPKSARESNLKAGAIEASAALQSPSSVPKPAGHERWIEVSSLQL